MRNRSQLSKNLFGVYYASIMSILGFKIRLNIILINVMLGYYKYIVRLVIASVKFSPTFAYDYSGIVSCNSAADILF